MIRPSHLFASEDGALYDTRVTDWHNAPPLRAIFDKHFATITNSAELRATLRAGPYTWPGGYPLFFIMADGEAMAFDAVKQELREILPAFASHDRHDSWRVVACEINYEDSDLQCCHTGELIESAYGEDEAPAVSGAPQ